MTATAGPISLLTSCQVRAARAMLRLSVQEMARECGVSDRTIKRIESQWGIPNVQVDSLLRLAVYFQGRGITFIAEDGSPEGPGVRYGNYPGRQLPDRG